MNLPNNRQNKCFSFFQWAQRSGSSWPNTEQQSAEVQPINTEEPALYPALLFLPRVRPAQHVIFTRWDVSEDNQWNRMVFQNKARTWGKDTYGSRQITSTSNLKQENDPNQTEKLETGKYWDWESTQTELDICYHRKCSDLGRLWQTAWGNSESFASVPPSLVQLSEILKGSRKP